MTIGVAASGPNAGAAVQAAVLGAELLGLGAIGGFAVYAAPDEEGRIKHCVAQRGGVRALTIPKDVLAARYAGIISSGPDRPEPLTQFLPAIEGVGMVTGHRLPNSLNAKGQPLNLAVLDLLAAGQSPQQAIDTVLGANAEIDAGLIAVDNKGNMGWGDSARVQRRSDRGHFYRDDGRSRLAILHNSIYSNGHFTGGIGDLAWTALTGEPTPTRFLYLRDAISVHASQQDSVQIDADGTITAIYSSNPRLLAAKGRSTAIYLGSKVWHEGRCVGHVVSELIADVIDRKVRQPMEPAGAIIVMRQDEHVAS